MCNIVCMKVAGSVTTKVPALPSGIEMRKGIIEHITPSCLQIFLLNMANTCVIQLIWCHLLYGLCLSFSVKIVIQMKTSSMLLVKIQSNQVCVTQLLAFSRTEGVNRTSSPRTGPLLSSRRTYHHHHHHHI